MFITWLGESELRKPEILEYKNHLCENYATSSVNSVLSALNSFFDHIGRYDLRVKKLKVQKQIFASDDRELTKTEYERLLNTARANGNERLYLLMQTVCSTGIRVSELKFITVEALKKACAAIRCKGKSRNVFLPDTLCKMLKRYVHKQKIKSGAVFVTRNGNPLDRLLSPQIRL